MLLFKKHSCHELFLVAHVFIRKQLLVIVVLNAISIPDTNVGFMHLHKLRPIVAPG